MLHDMNLKIKKAGGESTLSYNKKSMFPDVLLYADEEQTQILQGWELKLPDTLITDETFIKDAKRKAKALHLNSFFIWNFTYGVLYLDNQGDYLPVKFWTGTDFIKDRNDVVYNKHVWLPIIKDIVLEINYFFETGKIKTAGLIDSLSENIMMDIINRNKAVTAAYLEQACVRNVVMERKINVWWQEFRMEYMKEEKDMYSAYAKFVLLNWCNRIIFAHLIKRYHSCASKIESIDHGTGIVEANRIFEQMIEEGDFYNVFHTIPYNHCLPDQTWEDFVALNTFLTRNGICHIKQETLQKLLEQTVHLAKREIRGQFPTPPALADLLTNITVMDWTGHCGDVCSGTGTIVKSLLDNKEKRKMEADVAYATTWASDKYTYPLQISNISLTNIKSVQVPSNIFQCNAFDAKEGIEIEVRNPKDGRVGKKCLPAYHAITSNLPFVSSNMIDIDEKNHIEEIKKQVKDRTGISLDGKGDIYMYLVFSLYHLLADGGRFGLIISNSWLGTKAGLYFFEAMLYYYHLKCVIISGKGRWFQNADVVTTIVVLEKKAIEKPKEDETISFCLTHKTLDDLYAKEEIRENFLNSIILEQEMDADIVEVKAYSIGQIHEMLKYGISMNALFHDIGWLEKLNPILTPITNYFEVKRGERRGWNDLFYPEAGHGIEEEYLTKVLKAPDKLKSYMAETDIEAFCCHRSMEELEQLGHTGAWKWIRKFESLTNQIGKPLPEVLKKKGAYWYEMEDATKADFVTALNPNRRLFVSRFETPTFVDQRFTRLLWKKEEKGDMELCHALLNSIIGMFFIEAVGFGRGLGVLDASSSNFRKLPMLSPQLLSREQKDRIMQAFVPVCERLVFNTEEELTDKEREKFDRLVLSCFHIEEYYESIKKSLLSMQRSRLSVSKNKLTDHNRP